MAACCPPPIDWRRPAAEVALDRRCRRRGVRRPIAAPYGAVKLQRKGDRRTITGTPPALRLAGRALDGCGSRAPLAGGRDTSPLRDGKEVGSHVLTSRSGVLQSTRPPRFSVPTDDIDSCGRAWCRCGWRGGQAHNWYAWRSCWLVCVQAGQGRLRRTAPWPAPGD